MAAFEAGLEDVDDIEFFLVFHSLHQESHHIFGGLILDGCGVNNLQELRREPVGDLALKFGVAVEGQRSGRILAEVRCLQLPGIKQLTENGHTFTMPAVHAAVEGIHNLLNLRYQVAGVAVQAGAGGIAK